VVFQPHRYTRTQFLMREFGPAFAGADVVVLTDIYAAGEDRIDGVTLEALAKEVRTAFEGELHVVAALSDVSAALAARAQPGDLIVLLGAGSIGSIVPAVVAALGERAR
jgi:UDP-N-acetylmuramate--alanine ligase